MSASAKPNVNPLRFMGGLKEDRAGSELPLASIVKSKTNRVIEREGEEWKDYVASIARHGVIQPIVVRRLVREDGDATFYEIMAGERRYWGSIEAGRTHIPAIVRPEVADDEALALQITENVQRLDFQPLELAEKLYLLQSMGKTTAELAALVHKSEKRISDILSQLKLIQPLRAIYTRQHISYGHVMILSRLAPAIQERALRALYRISDTDKVSVDELLKRIDEDELGRSISEKELRAWAQENGNLKLKSAAWKLDDAELFSEAGPCATCLKRSINNPDLYREMSGGKDLCMDPSCYKEKSTRFVTIQQNHAGNGDLPYLRLTTKESRSASTDLAGTIRKNQWVPAKKGECPDSAQGIMLDGESAGKKLWVCPNATCAIHHHSELVEPLMKRETAHQTAARVKEEAQEREAENLFRRTAARAILLHQVGLDVTLRTYLTGLIHGEYSMTDAWIQVSEWYDWEDFPTSGTQTKYLDQKISTMSLEELSKLLVILHMALNFSEVTRFSHEDIGEQHNQVENLLVQLGLPSTPTPTAAATATPTKKGK